VKRFNRIMVASGKDEMEEMYSWARIACIHMGYTIIPVKVFTLDLNELSWSCAVSVLCDHRPDDLSKALDEIQMKVHEAFKSV